MKKNQSHLAPKRAATRTATVTESKLKHNREKYARVKKGIQGLGEPGVCSLSNPTCRVKYTSEFPGGPTTWYCSTHFHLNYISLPPPPKSKPRHVPPVPLSYAISQCMRIARLIKDDTLSEEEAKVCFLVQLLLIADAAEDV